MPTFSRITAKREPKPRTHRAAVPLGEFLKRQRLGLPPIKNPRGGENLNGGLKNETARFPRPRGQQSGLGDFHRKSAGAHHV